MLRAWPRTFFAASHPAPVPGGMGVVLGLAAGTVTTVVAAGLDAHGHPAVGLVLLGATVIAIAAATTLAGAFGVAVQCWALWDGFLINDLGRLTFTQQSTPALLLFVGSACLASLLATLLRRLPARRASAPVVVRHPIHDRRDRRCGADPATRPSRSR
ncbi:hypothetical protein ACFQE5_11955 [Pseudonocardia hispaniensis]|uniref:Uncharacterized protein n=1 Tax=Pseudonocardia hispaniensis TaxID=904933 RepID=A0ABW1J2Q1_9PSEU